MKPIIKFAVASAATCLLAACASTQEQASYSAPQSVENPRAIVTDSAYVAQVERVARRRGIQVQWVHMPTKRVSEQ
jgi:type IV pilus biogenesis protein CpaD/CtpE